MNTPIRERTCTSCGPARGPEVAPYNRQHPRTNPILSPSQYCKSSAVYRRLSTLGQHIGTAQRACVQPVHPRLSLSSSLALYKQRAAVTDPAVRSIAQYSRSLCIDKSTLATQHASCCRNTAAGSLGTGCVRSRGRSAWGMQSRAGRLRRRLHTAWLMHRCAERDYAAIESKMMLETCDQRQGALIGETK